MATIINVTKNTFNKTRQAKYALVKEIIESMIYRSYPNGCSGYEEFGSASKLFDIIVLLSKVRFLSNANTKNNLGFLPVSSSCHEMAGWDDWKRPIRYWT